MYNSTSPKPENKHLSTSSQNTRKSPNQMKLGQQPRLMSMAT